MDPDLLDEPTVGAPASRIPEAPNSQHDTEYRELTIDAPLKPLRVVLEPPIEYDGEKFPQLILDFESLTGKDFQRAEREFTHLYKADRNETMPLPEMKHLYHAIIAKNLANVPLGVIYKLPRRIYVPLRLEVLKACGSSPEEEKA